MGKSIAAQKNGDANATVKKPNGVDAQIDGKVNHGKKKSRKERKKEREANRIEIDKQRRAFKTETEEKKLDENNQNEQTGVEQTDEIKVAKEELVKDNKKKPKEERKKNKDKTKEAQNDNAEKKEINGKKNKKVKKGIVIGLVVTSLTVVIGVLLFIFAFGPIKRQVALEIGAEELSIKHFIRKEENEQYAKFITDISTIDLNKLAEHEIEIEFKEKTYKSKLKVIKTTPPDVVFQDVDKYIDYEINAEDFIKENNDLTKLEMFVEDAPIITDFGSYKVMIVVRDESGNEVRKQCNLNIIPVRTVYELELGEKIEATDILLNPEDDINIISREELDRINASDVGEYEMITILNEIEYITKIIIRDTTPPTLVLKEMQIYLGEKYISVDSFIIEKYDVSGEVTINMLTTIDYSKISRQEIGIEAIDKYGNTTIESTILNIVKDTRGPVFSGIGEMTVNKHADIDWYRGVTAKDPRDGTAYEFSVNVDSVNLTATGTYYANYTAICKLGNKTNVKRKVYVQPDTADVHAKADEWLARSGSGVIAIRNYVRDNISYNTSTARGMETAAWKGMTALNGDCYVYAATMQIMLTRSGYQSMIVNATDYTHYWNLVFVGGTWRHVDAMPARAYAGYDLMNDEQRKTTLSVIRDRDWDRERFPAAE